MNGVIVNEIPVFVSITPSRPELIYECSHDTYIFRYYLIDLIS